MWHSPSDPPLGRNPVPPKGGSESDFQWKHSSQTSSTVGVKPTGYPEPLVQTKTAAELYPRRESFWTWLPSGGWSQKSPAPSSLHPGLFSSLAGLDLIGQGPLSHPSFKTDLLSTYLVPHAVLGQRIKRSPEIPSTPSTQEASPALGSFPWS